MVNALIVLVIVANAALSFLAGWIVRSKSLERQVREIDGLQAALKDEIIRCRAIADAATASQYGKLLTRRRPPPDGWTH